MRLGDKVRFIDTDGKHPDYIGRPALIINADNRSEGQHQFVRVRWLDGLSPAWEYDEFLINRFVLDND